MNKHKNMQPTKQRGFTIIEVVLVLAIAGLIFLMVFVALPSLQRGQHDAQRKQDLSRILTQLQNYTTSSSGKVPSCSNTGSNTLASFVKGYLNNSSDAQQSASTADGELTTGSDYQDPSQGTGYTVKACQAPSQIGEIGYYSGYKCDQGPTEGVSTTTGNRSYAVTIKLENQSAPYCIDNKSS